MNIAITGKLSDDPRAAVMAIEGVTRELCKITGKDPAEAVMILLTAAAHIHSQYQQPGTDTLMSLATSLGYATKAAEGFFKLRPVMEPKP